MSKSSFIVLFVAIAIAACGLSYGKANQHGARPAQVTAKWEYKVIRLFDPGVATPDLNEAAAEGWELQECYQISRGEAFSTNAIMRRLARPVAEQ